MTVVFAVSGFTCSYSFRRSGSIRAFYSRRLKSLLPGFYTVLAVIVAVNVVCVNVFGRFLVGENIGFVSVLCNVLLLHGLLPFCNNNVFPGGWFVGTIVILYLKQFTAGSKILGLSHWGLPAQCLLLPRQSTG